MKKINSYIIEKLRISKDSKNDSIPYEFTKKGEKFSDEEKNKCVELSYSLPEQPISIEDGGKYKRINLVKLYYKNKNSIEIWKAPLGAFYITVFSRKYNNIYNYPNEKQTIKINTIEEVFDHIKHYFRYHKNWCE